MGCFSLSHHVMGCLVRQQLGDSGPVSLCPAPTLLVQATLPTHHTNKNSPLWMQIQRTVVNVGSGHLAFSPRHGELWGPGSRHQASTSDTSLDSLKSGVSGHCVQQEVTMDPK